MLILDSHVTHTKNLAATELELLPPHTTHRLQPLGVAFWEIQ